MLWRRGTFQGEQSVLWSKWKTIWFEEYKSLTSIETFIVIQVPYFSFVQVILLQASI